MQGWGKTLRRVKVEWWMVALGVVLVGFAIAAGFFLLYPHVDGYWKDVAPNTGAGFIDIVVVVIGFGLYDQHRSRRDGIARLRERIEDVKRFDDPRAHSIIASSVRALARFGMTDIDFRGAQLTNFILRTNGIKSIAGSVISDGFYAEDEMHSFAKFRAVDFYGVDCSHVCFGAGSISFGVYEDCNFLGSSLIAATFDGTTMTWSAEKVLANQDDWYEEVDTDDEGIPILAQHYVPAFYDASLAGCSFKNVRFERADFRGAKNVDQADFEGATGLGSCYFDEGTRPKGSARRAAAS